MIKRIITKTVIPMISLFPQSALLLSRQKFNFCRAENEQKAPPLQYIFAQQIKAENENLNNLASYQKEFSSGGWLINCEEASIELQKTIGQYRVRLLSDVKTPNQYKKQDEQQQQKQQVEINEVTIYITKRGSDKTMVVSTIVIRGFQIVNIRFSPNYIQAKASRKTIFSSNMYTGRQERCIPKPLAKAIKRFIADQIGVNKEIMEAFADYCLESEQNFYIQWLKDFQAII